MTDRFEDRRGVIQDLLGPVDSVTQIFTKKGSVRGNHTHKETVQWTYIVYGLLRVAWREDDGVHEDIYGPGDLIKESASVPHAWKAEIDTKVLVFTNGPRSGENYEKDTTRLDEKDWLLA
jgi:quercetin dioxygenase-like cupin family protein